MCNRAIPPLAVILALPLLAFDFGYLSLGPALVAAALLVGALALAFRDAKKAPPIDRKLLALCLGLGLLVVLLSGGGHFLYRTDDWTIRDALLVDLVRQPWPFAYDLGSGAQMLRAPLGVYLVPALVGKGLGLLAADLTMGAQNALALGLVLYLVAQEASTRLVQGILITVFVLFSGIDILPAVARFFLDGRHSQLPHPDGWGGIIQYSSHITLMFWTPNHALAGFAFAAAYLAWRRGQADIGTLGLVFAVALFWSPLAMMGALVLLVFAGLCSLRDGAIRPGALLVLALSGLAALPVFIFMTRDAGEVTSGFLGGPLFLALYAGLMIFEVLPFVAFMAGDLRESKDQRQQWEFLALLLPLLLFPFYTIGVDFSRRAIIPIVAVFAVRFASNLACAFETGLRGRRWIVPVLILCLATPGAEIMRNLLIPATPLSTCNLIDAWQSGPDRRNSMAHYFVDRQAFETPTGLFRAPVGGTVRAEDRRCWGDGQRHFTLGPPLLDGAPRD